MGRRVPSVRAKVDKATNKLWLLVEGSEDRELEEWTVRKKSELFREVFDLEVVVAAAGSRSA